MISLLVIKLKAAAKLHGLNFVIGNLPFFTRAHPCFQ